MTPSTTGADAGRTFCPSDFDFSLPPELIAQYPAAERSGARLLRVTRAGAQTRLQDGHIPDLLEACDAGDLLILNDTRVIKARLLGQKLSGGRVQVLVERILSPHRALVLLRSSHAPRPGTVLRFTAPDDRAEYRATVCGRSADLFELEFAQDLAAVLAAAGQIPLPPYIRHAPDARDATRYQTIYARTPGAVAAPTAGLHLSAALLQGLQQRGVCTAFITLHVGAGTFQPVRAARLEDHRMHAERFIIPAATADAIAATRAAGKRIVAVGTTCVRALEASVVEGAVRAGHGETRLFILPGFRFQCVDRLLTNFHLPGSSLMMLVCAFAGTAHIQRAYAHAIDQGYRFFSYGDAMLLERL